MSWRKSSSSFLFPAKGFGGLSLSSLRPLEAFAVGGSSSILDSFVVVFGVDVIFSAIVASFFVSF